MKSVPICNFSGPYFPAFRPNSVRMRENTDKKNSEYRRFSRSGISRIWRELGSQIRSYQGCLHQTDYSKSRKSFENSFKFSELNFEIFTLSLK